MDAPVYNTVAWFQVGTDDPDAAKRFYGRLFGWNFAADPDGGGRYDLISYPGEEAPSGGIAHAGGPTPNPHAIFLVVVEDVAAVCAETEQAGGKVVVPATASPNGLVFADLVDPAGNHFGVFSPPSA